jgi:hypothetical protein
MSDQELRQYFLKHRQDQDALQAYLERRKARSTQIITSINDPDFGEKIEAAVLKQVNQHRNN